MDESMADGRVEDSFTHVPETSTVASKSQHETEETDGGCGEVMDEANADNNIEAKIDMDESMVNGGGKTFPTLILEAWAVATGPLGHGPGETKLPEARTLRSTPLVHCFSGRDR